jgi:hypothetical protein
LTLEEPHAYEDDDLGSLSWEWKEYVMGSTARNVDGSRWRSLPKAPGQLFSELPSTPLRSPMRLPELSREGLQWGTNGANVDIIVEMTNGSSEPTAPAVLVIEAAPLGAFVPGYEIARVPVLALDPGGSRRVPVRVARALLPTTRGPSEWPALTEAREPSLQYVMAVAEVLGPAHWGAAWVGNVCAWFKGAAGRSVEAHRASDLKVAAGRRIGGTIALPPAKGGFDFAITGAGAGWTAEIVFRPGWPQAWFIIGAPAAGRHAAITLFVTRRSDGYTLPVEFTLQSVEAPPERPQLECARA